MPKKDRQNPLTVPLSWTVKDGQARLELAPGVQWAIGQKERTRRFNAEPVRRFLARYQQAGGDPQRLKPVLEGLLPVKAPPSPPIRRVLKSTVRKAFEALTVLLQLPGNLPGRNARQVFERAATQLRQFDEQAYRQQFTSHTPSQYAVRIPVTVVGAKWLPPQDQQSGTCLLLSYPEDKDRPLQFPLVPPIGAPGRGRMRRGSPAGSIIGVLAEECRRCFEAPWWPDILAVCLALAPETFDTTCDTAERLRKRVERLPKDHITNLHRLLFPTN